MTPVLYSDAVQAARDMAEEVLAAIPDPADRLAFARRWSVHFGRLTEFQAQAEAFREAAATIEIFLENP